MLTLSKVKENLRLDDGDDDVWISEAIDEALELFSKDCNRKIVNTQQAYDAIAPEDLEANTVVLTPAMERAVVVLICHWYINRESHTDIKLVETPMSYQHIVDRFRILPC